MKLLRTLGLAAVCVAATGTASALEPRSGVVLRALDKITGNSIDLDSRIGETIEFGRLEITVRACFQAPPEDTPESAAYLEVDANTPAERERLPGGQEQTSSGGAQPDADGHIFSGWMFASSPGLNALDHPTYDVWVISCKTA